MGLLGKEFLRRIIPRSMLVRELRPAQRPAFLLTFDDGPHPTVTAAVLDRLGAYDAKAVFFLVGKRAHHQRTLVQRIRDEGHRIGNHTHDHVYPEGSFLRYYRDVERCQSVITEQTGAAPQLFRPPGGRLTMTSLTVPRLLGLRTITWSLDVADWALRDADQAARAADDLERRAAAGQIAVLHDDNPRVLDVLDYVLPRLAARGFDLRNAVDLL